MGFKYIVSRSLFLAYEHIRQSGKYNMINHAKEVCDILATDIDTYIYIQKNYKNYKNLYQKGEKDDKKNIKKRL